MSLEIFRKKSANAGFGKILGAAESDFILLSDNTDGRCGRYVSIDKALSKVFVDHVAKDEANLILHKLEQLRASAGGLKSFSNMQNAFEHFSTIDRFQVGYKIFMDTGSSQSKPGVYITSLEALNINDADHRPGLYDVRKDDNRWDPEEAENINFNYAAVNGLTKNLQMAANEIIPPMLEAAYNSKEYASDVKNGYSLVYNPPQLYYKNKVWKTPQSKQQGKDFTARLLGDAILDAQRRGKSVNWVVHGDGAKVFHDAMQRISGHNLDKHQVLFLAPKADMVKILPMVRQSKMKLHSSVMKFQADDWNWEGGKNRISKNVAKEVAKFGEEFQNKAAAMSEEAGINRDKLIGLSKKSFKVGGMAASYVLHPALPAIAGAANTALGMPAMKRSIESIRNISANNIADPNLNPHLHPFKSTPEMNAFVANQTGGKAKSFAALIKAKLKGRKS